MPKELHLNADPRQPTIYEIRIEGRLDPGWGDWFPGLAVTPEVDGDTLLTGPVADQAALHGLLRRVRDLGVPLLSINRVEPVERAHQRNRRETDMKTYRKTAVAVGILFVLATALSLLSSALTKGVGDAADHLATIAGRGDQFVAGALLAIGAGVCCVLIAALLFPVLRRRNEGMALGYLGLRVMEAMTLMLTAVSLLLLVTLGRQSVATGVSAGSLRAAAALVEGLHEWAFPLDPIVFGLGAVLFYSLLYAARLVPRWLSVWGLAGAVAVFVMAVLRMYGQGTLLLAVPIGVQEMVLAGWLIARGFDTSAVASEAAPRAEKTTSRGARQVPVLDLPGTQS